MKTFKNQQTQITIAVQGTTELKSMTYADLATFVLAIPPVKNQDGSVSWPRAEQKIRFKIEDKLETLEVDAELKLEDAEFDKIFELSQQPWQFKHRDLLKYLDDLDEWNKE